MSIIYAMYFSGKESNAISIDDPNVTVYCRVQNFNEKNIRVFLDTHLLRIRNYGGQENNVSD